MRKWTLLCLVGTLLSLPACSILDDEAVEADYPPIESADFGSMRNVSTCGTIWFGGVPCEEDLELASRRGVQTLIDLTVAEERDGGPDLRVACAELGLEYCDAGLSDTGGLDDATVDYVLARLEEEDAEPVLMFCGNGSRCALLIAIHRSVSLGVPVEEALEDARRAGMKPGTRESFARDQVARLTGSSPVEQP